jgi:hypothetical protein
MALDNVDRSIADRAGPHVLQQIPSLQSSVLRVCKEQIGASQLPDPYLMSKYNAEMLEQMGKSSLRFETQCNHYYPQTHFGPSCHACITNPSQQSTRNTAC